MPLPLVDVGKGFLTRVHCRQRKPKEPHFSRGCEVTGLNEHNTSITVHILQPFTNSFVVVYLDDTLIFNQSWEERLHHIQQVLQTLGQHKLCANLEKCTFGMTQVQYLGYIIDEQGVHVDPTKIQVIQNWPALTTLTELRSFLGLTNFYHRFVL